MEYELAHRNEVARGGKGFFQLALTQCLGRHHEIELWLTAYKPSLGNTGGLEAIYEL